MEISLGSSMSSVRRLSPIALFDLGELFDDDLGHHFVRVENLFEVGDELH